MALRRVAAKAALSRLGLLIVLVLLYFCKTKCVVEVTCVIVPFTLLITCSLVLYLYNYDFHLLLIHLPACKNGASYKRSS